MSRRLSGLVLPFAITGYAVALGVQALAQRFLISTRTIQMLVPFTIFTMRFPVDVSWSAILLLIGPINAITYGGLGLILGLCIPHFRKPVGPR